MPKKSSCDSDVILYACDACKVSQQYSSHKCMREKTKFDLRTTIIGDNSFYNI